MLQIADREVRRQHRRLGRGWRPATPEEDAQWRRARLRYQCADRARGHPSRQRLLRGVVRDVTSVLDRFAIYAEAWLLRAQARVELTDYEAALADFDTSLRLEPGSIAALRGRAGALSFLGTVDCIFGNDAALMFALADIEELLRLCPDDTEAIHARARLKCKRAAFSFGADVAVRANDFEDAAQDFEALWLGGHDDDWILDRLLEALARRVCLKPDDAGGRAALERLVTLYDAEIPDDYLGDTHLWAGRAFAAAGSLHAGVRALRFAAACFPTFKEIREEIVDAERKIRIGADGGAR